MEACLANSPVEKDAIYSFRYSIYIEELGKTFLDHDPDRRILKDELDDESYHICLLHHNDLVGCVRLRYPAKYDPEFARLKIPVALQEKYRISIAGRMMLKKEYRQTKGFILLMNYVYDKCIRDGIDFGLIEVEKHLSGIYKRYGFHELGTRMNENNQERIVMFVNSRDCMHFNEIHSPYGSVFQKMVKDMNQEFHGCYQN